MQPLEYGLQDSTSKIPHFSGVDWITYTVRTNQCLSCMFKVDLLSAHPSLSLPWMMLVFCIVCSVWGLLRAHSYSCTSKYSGHSRIYLSLNDCMLKIHGFLLLWFLCLLHTWSCINSLEAKSDILSGLSAYPSGWRWLYFRELEHSARIVCIFQRWPFILK